jgi:hypothetical protein
MRGSTVLCLPFPSLSVPCFVFEQLYHGIDTTGLAGSWLSDALNTNNHTFEVAPVFIVVEKALLRSVPGTGNHQFLIVSGN